MLFKVGDVVRATDDGGGLYPKGATGVVKELDDGLCLVDFGDDLRVPRRHVVGGRTWWARTSILERASAARSTDPATSKGKRRINKYEQAVLDILKGLYKDQGYTGKQIASLTGHPLNCITPRFAPLRRRGLIKPQQVLIDGTYQTIKRDKQIVWVLVN